MGGVGKDLHGRAASQVLTRPDCRAWVMPAQLAGWAGLQNGSPTPA